MRMNERLRALEAKVGPDVSRMSDEEIEAQIQALFERLTSAGFPIDPEADLTAGMAQIRAALDDAS